MEYFDGGVCLIKLLRRWRLVGGDCILVALGVRYPGLVGVRFFWLHLCGDFMGPHAEEGPHRVGTECVGIGAGIDASVCLVMWQL